MASLISRTHGKKSKSGDPLDEEWETHAVVRVPDDVAPFLNEFIDSGSQYDISNPQPGPSNPEKRVAIKFAPNKRTGQLKVGRKNLDFVVQDLPCIVETYKTQDKTNIYKVADVSQIINCKSPPELPEIKQVPESERNDPEFKEQIAKRDKLLQHPHGITPPVKSVRRRRWRKTKKMKFMDAPQVEQEIKRLLRLDLQAVNIRWEVIDVDQKKPVKIADSQE
ncbi:hypothetical protein FO519_006186 [Halicephalobus sp. NKZ332]|nr:hypothetical protein FO519_006186 [Halicephalobus sp. NKZ332]